MTWTAWCKPSPSQRRAAAAKTYTAVCAVGFFDASRASVLFVTRCGVCALLSREPPVLGWTPDGPTAPACCWQSCSISSCFPEAARFSCLESWTARGWESREIAGRTKVGRKRFRISKTARMRCTELGILFPCHDASAEP